MPVYREYILAARAIGSVMMQSDPSWEIIMLNDGVDPLMRAVATDAMGSGPGQTKNTIRYYELPYRGMRGGHHMIQTGIDVARGEFICILNGDNVLYKNYVKEMYDAEIDIATCYVRMNDMPGIIIDGKCFQRGRIDRLCYAVRTKIAQEVQHKGMMIDADWKFIIDCLGWNNPRQALRMKHVEKILGEHN